MHVRLLAGKFRNVYLLCSNRSFFPNQLLFHPLKLQIAERRGPGGIVPYRVYVNSGVIFLCVVALAPLCPVLAPFSTLYFMFIYPLLKWGHIFVYRPTFDAGGMRWPLLHNILMNSVIVSQVRAITCWKKQTLSNYSPFSFLIFPTFSFLILFDC